jgi:hypothetical protein
VDEIKKMLGAGGAVSDIDDAEWEQILDEVDEDGNGEISFKEFKHMIYKLFSIQRNKKDDRDEEDGSHDNNNMPTLKHSNSYLQSQPTDNNGHAVA